MAAIQTHMSGSDMEYGVNFLDFCQPDELCGELPADFMKIVAQCERHPTHLALRIKLLEASQELSHYVDLDKQRFNINTLVILKLLAVLPMVQEDLLAATMGLREEIFQLNELLWRWLTNRSSSDQKDEPKKIKKLFSTADNKVMLLIGAINDQLTEPYLSKARENLLKDCLTTTARLNILLDKLQH